MITSFIIEDIYKAIAFESIIKTINIIKYFIILFGVKPPKNKLIYETGKVAKAMQEVFRTPFKNLPSIKSVLLIPEHNIFCIDRFFLSVLIELAKNTEANINTIAISKNIANLIIIRT